MSVKSVMEAVVKIIIDSNYPSKDASDIVESEEILKEIDPDLPKNIRKIQAHIETSGSGDLAEEINRNKAHEAFEELDDIYDNFGKDVGKISLKVKYNKKGDKNPHIYDSLTAQENIEKHFPSPKKNDSDCYITTACVRAMGLPDDCLELATLRWLKDNKIVKTAEGRKALKEYDEVGPEIVKSINYNADSSGIWKYLHSEIRKAVAMVLSGDNEGAFSHYRKISLELKKYFL